VLQPAAEDVQAGGEPFVAVVEPDVGAEGDQGGEAVGGSERKNSCSWVLVAASRTCCSLTAVGAADREADGVVDQEEEGKAGLVVAEPGSLWWCKDRFGQGEGVRPERSRVLRSAATLGWRSSTARSRWASSLSCWVQG
jgi:hypothetical protein